MSRPKPDRPEGVDSSSLGRLLSGEEGPSVLEKEAVFEAAFQSAQPASQGVRAWGRWLALAGAVATAAVLLVVKLPDDGFQSRGPAKPAVGVRCLRAGVKAACSPGAKLLFEVRSDKPRFFSAFSISPGGTAIWYLPSEGEKAQPVLPGAAKVLKRGYVLGEDHPPGDYTMYGLFTEAPMSKKALKAELSERLVSTARVHVLTVPWTVHARASP